MKKVTVSRSIRGFAILGILIAMVILGSMAAGISALVSANQRSRAAKIYTDQAFYITHAAFESTLRETKANKNLSLPSRQLMGSNFGLSRLNFRIYSQSSYGNSPMFASNAYSICDPGTGAPCFFVLDSSGSGALSLTGTADILSSNCGIHVNSSSSTAVTTVGASTIDSAFLSVVGGVSNPSAITVCGQIRLSAPPVSDPLAAYNLPSYSSCTHTNFSVTSSATLDPGVYCGGIEIKGSGIVLFNPGNYIIDGGELKIGGTATVSGDGVTFFLNKQIESTFATVSITGGGPTTLKAPTSGSYAGILIFQSRSATSDSNTINGGGSLNLTGAVYLPNQSLDFRGGNSTTAPCTMFVVGQLSLSGSANVGCPAGSLAGLVP